MTSATVSQSTFRDFRPRRDDNGDWRQMLSDAVGPLAVIHSTDVVGRTLIVHWSCDTAVVREACDALVGAVGMRAAMHWLESKKFDPDAEPF